MFFFSGRQTGALNRGWFNCVTVFFWMLLQAFCCLKGKNAKPWTFEGSGYFSNVGSYVKQGSSMVAWGGWPLPEAKMDMRVLGRFLSLGFFFVGISCFPHDKSYIPFTATVVSFPQFRTGGKSCQVTVLDSWHHCFVWGFCSESNGCEIQNEGQLWRVSRKKLLSCQVWRLFIYYSVQQFPSHGNNHRFVAGSRFFHSDNRSFSHGKIMNSSMVSSIHSHSAIMSILFVSSIMLALSIVSIWLSIWFYLVLSASMNLSLERSRCVETVHNETFQDTCFSAAKQPPLPMEWERVLFCHERHDATSVSGLRSLQT